MYVQVNIASSCSVLLKRLISLDRYAFYFSALHSDSAPWSLLLASRNKSFVLLGKFASAIRSAYKCGNKICLLLLPSLFQPLPYPLQHFTLSFTFFHSLAHCRFSLVWSYHPCFVSPERFTNTKSKINCFSSWQFSGFHSLLVFHLLWLMFYLL